VPRNDLAAITAITQELYAVDLEQLETQWVEYCKKRK
jgi:hypothetical protein